MRGARGKRNVMAARKKQREEKNAKKHEEMQRDCRTKSVCEGPCSWRRAKRNPPRFVARAIPARCTLPRRLPRGLPAAPAPNQRRDTAHPLRFFRYNRKKDIRTLVAVLEFLAKSRPGREKNKGHPQCRDVLVSIAGEGTSVKRVCLSEKRRRIMKKIMETRKAAFDALAKY
jgi:hypothetical protein